MSTETSTRRAQARTRRGRGFLIAFAGVVAGLAVLGAAGAAVSTAQGPRITDVQVDPEAALEASGARLILTTSQALQEVDPAQVSVEPETPFAVDTSGRRIGIRFALPLWDETRYTVTIEGVRGVGGGPESTISHTFRTGKESFFLLQRGDEEDAIFRTDLTGEQAMPVFRHAHIEDYRATPSALVVSVRERTGSDQAEQPGEADGLTRLVVTDLDGSNERDLALPGDGTVTNLQSSDRADLIGYTFTDAGIGLDGGRESALFTVSLKDPDAEPRAVEVEGADNRVVQWRFVPETDRVLFVGFDGAMWLTDASGSEATSLGSALGIDDVTGATAIVDRADGLVALDLRDATEQQLTAPDPPIGQLRSVLSVPGGGTVRLYAVLDEFGIPGGSAVVRVGDDGRASVLAEVPASVALIRACTSPNGRYVSVVMAPDITENPYDRYLLPMPERTQTHIIEIASGDEVVALKGFDSSWCRVPPQ